MTVDLARRLAGRTVLVTGGLSGIGRAVASRVHAEGAAVIVADARSTSRDDEAPASEVTASMGPRARYRALDVTDESAVAAVFADEAVDGVVHCAGVTAFAPLAQLTHADYRRIFDVNVGGTFLVTREACRTWSSRGVTGAIVNIASNMGFLGAEDAALYGASKAAVITFGKSVALEYGAHGIRVNSLCPGAIQTQFNHAYRAVPGNLAAWEARTPLKRGTRTIGVVEDVAAAAAFLVSDESGYMTGAELVVDGGWNCS